MKNKLVALTLIIVASLCKSAVFAQELPLETFLKKLSATSSKNAQEKIHLHLDKPFYAVGDDIWFKVYTINAKTGQPSLISNLVYVELINEKDSVSRQLKLPMSGGITWGDFKLTDSLAEGNYRIRAYTQWMRNAGTDFFFDKTIKVGNSWANKVFTKAVNEIKNENNLQVVNATVQFTDKQNLPYTSAEVLYQVKVGNKNVEKGKGVTNTKGEITINFTNKPADANKSGFIIATITLPNKQKVTKEILLQTASKNVDIQFFPEGGMLVEGLPNKIGVKAVNSSGLGEIVKGAIVNADGVEISAFNTNKLGMAAFFLNPDPNSSYKAKVTLSDGSEKILDVPKAAKSGAVLSVNNIDNSKMQIKIYLSPDLLNSGGYSLVAHHNGTVFFNTEISSTKQVVSATVPKDSLPSGITTISLLNKEFLPVNERIVFINNMSDKIVAEAENLKASYSKREKVDFNLITKNGEKPVQGSFSIAVTNTTAVKPDPENETNILTKLLLTSDLVGYVEKPNYYFLNDDPETRQHLDNLLLTQGWRKLNWKEIKEDKEPVNSFGAEKKLQISGRAMKGGKPVVKGKISLVSFSGGFFMTDTLTDENGRFNFDKIEFLDSTKFIVQARTDKDKKFVDIEMDKVTGQAVTKNPNTGDIEVNVNQSLSGYLEESGKYFDDLTRRGLLNRTILLDAVNIVEKRRPDIQSSNLNGAGNADAVFTAKDFENAISLGQFLQGRIAGVQIVNGQAFARNSQSPMAIMVDGMNFGGEDTNLDDVVIQDIETVEILKSGANTAIYGMNGGSGVIVITTKRGQGIRSVNPYTPGLINISPKGYAVSREFYSPKYDTQPESRPDYRTTVYWNPQIITDVNGKTNISYFNTDVPGSYRMVIEGIDADGSLARKVLSYEVK
jgi:TonB-dependent SusC/RagA subfamily outer membrane receptor